MKEYCPYQHIFRYGKEQAQQDLESTYLPVPIRISQDEELYPFPTRNSWKKLLSASEQEGAGARGRCTPLKPWKRDRSRTLYQAGRADALLSRTEEEGGLLSGEGMRADAHCRGFIRLPELPNAWKALISG